MTKSTFDRNGESLKLATALPADCIRYRSRAVCDRGKGLLSAASNCPTIALLRARLEKRTPKIP